MRPTWVSATSTLPPASATIPRALYRKPDHGRSARQTSQVAGSGEHAVQHRLGELAGEGVLLTRVVGAEQYGAALGPVLGEVAEVRARPDAEQPAGRVPGELAEADHHGRLDQP